MSADIDTIMADIQKNRTKLVELNVRKEHATKEIAECETQLKELGWDGKKDIATFVDELRSKIETMEQEIEAESADITEALAVYDML